MKIFNKFIAAFLSIGLMAGMVGCNQQSGGNTPTQKKDPTISISLQENQEFEENHFVEPTITVTPAELEKTVSYFKGEEKLSAAPQVYGDYLLKVETKETAEYNAGQESRHFAIRKMPVITFYSGEDALDDGCTLPVGSTITAKTQLEGVNPTLTFFSVSGLQLNAMPQDAGVYTVKATVARTEVVAAAEAELSFELQDASKVNPVIKFFYGGEPVAVENNWLGGGYMSSRYYPDQVDTSKITWSVEPSTAAFTVSYAVNEAPIEALPNPLTPGTYSITITVNDQPRVNEGAYWLLFEIIAVPTKIVPTVTFFLGGVETSREAGVYCIAGNWPDSTFEIGHLPEITFTVNPVDEENTDWWYEQDEVKLGKEVPTQAGTYAYVVHINESDEHEALHAYVLFVLEAASELPAASVTFYIDGVAQSREAGVNCIAGNWPGSTFTIGSVPELSFSVDPADPTNTTWHFELDEVNIGQDMPTQPGTYAYVVDVAEGLTKGGHFWVLFVLEAASELPAASVTFYIDGVAQEREAGVNCIAGNWPGSTFTIGSVPELSFSVNPADPSNTTWHFEFNETNIGQDMPTEPGTYAYVVDVAEGLTKGGHFWVLFVLEAPAAPQAQPLPVIAQGNQPTKVEGAGAWIYLDNTELGITGANAGEISVQITLTVSMSDQTPEESKAAAQNYITGADFEVLVDQANVRFDDYGTNTVRLYIGLDKGLDTSWKMLHAFEITVVINGVTYASSVNFIGGVLQA